MTRKGVVSFGAVKCFLKPFLKRSFKPIVLAILVFSLIVFWGEKLPLLANQSAEQKAAALIEDGKLLLEKGRAELALEKWESAEEIYREIGNYEGIVGSQLNQGFALESMGFYRDSCNIILAAFPRGVEVNKCDELDENNIEAVIKAILKNSRHFNEIAWENLVNRLRLLGKWRALEKVLEFDSIVPTEKASIYLTLGNVAKDLAALAKIRGEEQESNKLKEKAIENYNEAIALADGNLIGLQAQLNYLSLFLLENTDKIDIFSAEIFDLRRKIDGNIKRLFASNNVTNSELGYAVVNYATTLQKFWEYEIEFSPQEGEIVEILERAIALAEKLQNQRLLSFAKGILGEVGKDQKELEEALKIALKIDAPELAYQWEWQIGQMLREKGDREGAIAYYRPAFSILQDLRTNLVALNRDTQFNFRDEIEDFYIEYADLLLQEEQPKQEYLREAREVIEALQLAELDNFFREACVAVKEQDLDKIVDESNPPTALIYPIVFDDRVDVIVKLPEPNKSDRERKLLYVSHSVLKNEFYNTINDILALINSSSPSSELNGFFQQLYQWLLQDFEDEFQNHSIKTLVFVLDSLLQQIPMAALYDGEKYLIQKYNLAISLSLQLEDYNPIKKENLTTLAAGASASRKIEGIPEPIPALTNVPEELDAIRDKLSAEIISEEGFTKTQLDTLMGSDTFSIVHLATHGRFTSNRDNTYVVTWNELLLVDEIQNLLQPGGQRDFQNVDLLVLTACETAKNDPRAALGMAGVAVSAGARSTIASLWQLGDNSAVVFVEKLYEELSNNPNMTKAEAVRLAQESVLQQRKAPFYWAPFVLIGNWQ